jgi:hypothetical protein
VSCPRCHRKGFHALTCPELEVQIWIAFSVLTVGLGAIYVNWASGGRRPPLMVLGLVTWAALGLAAISLRRWRHRADQQGKPPRD